MKGSVDVAQTIRTYLNTRRGSMLVGGMNPLRGRGKADASDEAILRNHCASSVCATVDPQPGQGDRSAQLER
jgi:hypothetical protein